MIYLNNKNIVFCRCHDLGNTDLWDKIHLLFKAAIDNEDMSPEVNRKKKISLFFYLIIF